jgi:hypothetical protein
MEMQAAIMMIVALSGLGCNHKSCEMPASCAPTFPCVDQARYAIEYSTIVEPSVYSPCRGPSYTCIREGRARDGWGPSAGGYAGCFAGGAIGCGCGRFPHHS